MDRLKQIAMYAKQHGIGKAAAVFGVTVLAVQNAVAALPTEAAAAFTSMSTNVTDVSGALWPVVAAVISLFFLVKIVKRGASKA